MMILSGVGMVAIIMNDEKNIEGMAWKDSVAVWSVALLMMIAYELDGPFNPALKKRIELLEEQAHYPCGLEEFDDFDKLDKRIKDLENADSKK